MGCTSSRNDMTPSEATLFNGEQSLLYPSFSTSEFFKIHLECSEKGIVSPDNWSKIAKRLKLAISFADAGAKITAFYEHFKIGENYSLKKLLTLALLLSKASGPEKSRLLFNLYDPENKKKIDKAAISEIVDNLFEISIERIPTLILENDNNGVSQEDMGRFIEDSRRAIEQSKEVIIAGVSEGKEEVDTADFTAYFSKDGNDGWLDSRGLRKKLRKLGL